MSFPASSTETAKKVSISRKSHRPLVPAIALLLGIVSAYLFFRQQISVIEGRARNDPGRRELLCTSTIRKGRNRLIKNHGADHYSKHRLLQRGILRVLSCGRETGRVMIPSYCWHAMKGDTDP